MMRCSTFVVSEKYVPLRAMYIVTEYRVDPKTDQERKYYRIKESYRGLTDTVHNFCMLTIGYLNEELEPEQTKIIGEILNARMNRDPQCQLLVPDTEGLDPIIAKYADRFWGQLIESNAIDRFLQRREEVIERERKAIEKGKKEEEDRENKRKWMDTDTAEDDPSLNIGAEWLVIQTLNRLKLKECLLQNGFTEEEARIATICLTTRTIYPGSELNAYKIMRENSGVCNLVYGRSGVYPPYRMVYSIPDKLLTIKSQIESHMCGMTDNLFNQKTAVLLYDLTNFYFEGRKAKSEKANYGRSKESRSDCKIVVLALCIDTGGFIRYSAILEGNTADPKSLPEMIENVILSAPGVMDPSSRPLVIMDAGIASQENLDLIKSKGFNYLCVSRKRLKDVELKAVGEITKVLDAQKREIRIQQLKHEEGSDYFFQVTSPAKALTESSMNRLFKERFENELKRAQAGITKKHGTKTYEKVIERVGKAKAHYPSIAKYYDIKFNRSESNPKHMESIEWKIKPTIDLEQREGKYFLQTNMSSLDGLACWEFYNQIRDIECANRQLKTDLELRPIYHQTDDRAESHLFMGLLSYTIINTIRYQLKV